ncbi:hypothetical protein OEZ85_011011 [Tetradesmus obliquus]|uniref:Radical SAM core domain-containing protein n=1 Tax=Tetradesmus obliquus TaxID=3088 RepID=A0ABY8TP83_TETOB|nr:hypothetical protein OEZ85_011011 [Tetradesmus obliquus]
MVDGMGRRAIVFLHGCPLRCLFCANPETSRAAACATSSCVSVQQVVDRLKRLQSYQLDGITVSGGEPLVQPQFTAALMREARAQLGWTCTLDTSGCSTRAAVRQEVADTAAQIRAAGVQCITERL